MLLYYHALSFDNKKRNYIGVEVTEGGENSRKMDWERMKLEVITGE